LVSTTRTLRANPGPEADPYPRVFCEQVRLGMPPWPFARDTIRASRAAWDDWCRVLAFLRSDVEYVEPPEMKPVNARTNLPGVWVFRAHLLGLAVALGAAWKLGWWLFGAAWVASFAAIWFRYPHGWRPDDAPRDDAGAVSRPRDPAAGFVPFPSAESWAAHKHLLRPFGLPTYDPELHNPPLLGLEAWLPRLVRGVAFLVAAVLVVAFAPWSLFGGPAAALVLILAVPSRLLGWYVAAMMLLMWPLGVLAFCTRPDHPS
jgi:hypothetical protein